MVKLETEKTTFVLSSEILETDTPKKEKLRKIVTWKKNSHSTVCIYLYPLSYIICSITSSLICFYFSAVKFGRMSKKQREKVEEEAEIHKRNRLNGFGEGNISIDGNNTSPTTPTKYAESPVTPNNNQYVR